MIMYWPQVEHFLLFRHFQTKTITESRERDGRREGEVHRRDRWTEWRENFGKKLENIQTNSIHWQPHIALKRTAVEHTKTRSTVQQKTAQAAPLSAADLGLHGSNGPSSPASQQTLTFLSQAGPPAPTPWALTFMWNPLTSDTRTRDVNNQILWEDCTVKEVDPEKSEKKKSEKIISLRVLDRGRDDSDSENKAAWQVFGQPLLLRLRERVFCLQCTHHNTKDWYCRHVEWVSVQTVSSAG